MNAGIENIRRSWNESTAPLRQRWMQLSGAEQRALRLLGGFLAVVVFVYGIWLPSQHAAESARATYENSRELLLWMQSAAARLEGGPASAAGGSVLAVVSNQASSSGLALSRIEPEGDTRVRVWLEKADFNLVAGWLGKLAGQGVRLDEVQVEKQGEGGGVSGRFVLSR